MSPLLRLICALVSSLVLYLFCVFFCLIVYHIWCIKMNINSLVKWIKLSFRPGNVCSYRKKALVEALERQIAEMAGLGTAFPRVPTHFYPCILTPSIKHLHQTSSTTSELSW